MQPGHMSQLVDHSGLTMPGQVQTVNGSVGPTELGLVLMHEHIVTRTPGLAENYPQTFPREQALRAAVDRLTELRTLGVGTVVDHTTYDMGRDADLIAEASRASGVRIVCVTGVWREIPLYFRGPRDPEAIADLYCADIQDGIRGGPERAGLIKLAIEEADPSPAARVLGKAVAIAHFRTGMPITTHTSSESQSGRAVLRLLLEEGVDPARIIIGHAGDSPDRAYLEELLAQGVYLGLDRFGLEDVLPDGERVAVTKHLIDLGYANRLMLGADASCYKDRTFDRHLVEQRTHWAIDHIPKRILPALRDAGVSDADLDQMTRRNPMAFLPAGTPA